GYFRDNREMDAERGGCAFHEAAYPGVGRHGYERSAVEFTPRDFGLSRQRVRAGHDSEEAITREDQSFHPPAGSRKAADANVRRSVHDSRFDRLGIDVSHYDAHARISDLMG